MGNATGGFTWRSKDTGAWFALLLVVYLIVVVKVATGSYLAHNPFFGAYSVLIVGYIFSRFVLSYLHRPVYGDASYEPSVAFVVPAKNEEDNIYETLRRFAEVEYPLSKVEVIAINDGSTDGTLAEMRRAARDIGSSVARVEVVNWEVNRGKRYGMYEGVKRARSEIVIFIDSDSFIESSAVRHLVKYFTNPVIGAVSGHTDVYNRDTNEITRMQALRYYIAFTIYKAAESVFGLVTCCPGCCSAYRKRYLDEFVDEWLHQKFLGKECTFGDDRSLTNFMLRTYRAAYAYDARAFTVVPDTFAKYRKQQQRWKKSWVRETFIAASFIWRKDPAAAFFFYSYIFLAFAGPIVFLHAVVWTPIILGILPVVYLSGLLLMLMLNGLYYRLRTNARDWFVTVFSLWFFSIILMWQLPWAFVTIADTRWGTR